MGCIQKLRMTHKCTLCQSILQKSTLKVIKKYFVKQYIVKLDLRMHIYCNANYWNFNLVLLKVTNSQQGSLDLLRFILISMHKTDTKGLNRVNYVDY